MSTKTGEVQRDCSVDRVQASSCTSPLCEGEQSSSSRREEFLSRLKGCDGYPFDEKEDSRLYDFLGENYPGVDLLGELDKKLRWWRVSPEALESRKDPRDQLIEWMCRGYNFQRKKRQIENQSSKEA